MWTAWGAGLCVTAMTILGTSVTFSRAIIDYPPLIGQAARYTVAAAILFGLSTVGRAGHRAHRPTGRDLALLAALAASGLAAFNLCILLALRHSDPAVVGTVVGAAPIGLAIAAPLLRRERAAVRVTSRREEPSASEAPQLAHGSWRPLGAAVVIVAGIAIVHGGGSSDGIGLLAAAGALVGEVLFSLLAAPLLTRLGTVRTSAYSCALAVPMLLVAAVLAGETHQWRLPTVPEALAYAYLATALTVGAFLAWFTGLNRLGVDRAGLFVGILPVSTLVSTAVVDERWPSPLRVAGVGVVAAGLAVGLTRSRTGRRTDGRAGAGQMAWRAPAQPVHRFACARCDIPLSTVPDDGFPAAEQSLSHQFGPTERPSARTDPRRKGNKTRG